MGERREGSLLVSACQLEWHGAQPTTLNKSLTGIAVFMGRVVEAGTRTPGGISAPPSFLVEETSRGRDRILPELQGAGSVRWPSPRRVRVLPAVQCRCIYESTSRRVAPETEQIGV